jgi:F-type H+-transporting ATPase subunit b
MLVVGAVLANDYVFWWIAQLVAIAILIFLFLRWKPGFLAGKTIGQTLGGALDARKAQIDDQLAAAERSRQEAERIHQQTQQDIEKARSEAQQIVSGAARTSEAIKTEIVQRAQEEGQRILAQAKAEIGQERNQALQALQRRAADIVVDAAGQIVSQHGDERADQQLINSSLRRLGDHR